jgi:hypothetical protein
MWIAGWYFDPRQFDLEVVRAAKGDADNRAIDTVIDPVDWVIQLPYRK